MGLRKSGKGAREGASKFTCGVKDVDSTARVFPTIGRAGGWERHGLVMQRSNGKLRQANCTLRRAVTLSEELTRENGADRMYGGEVRKLGSFCEVYKGVNEDEGCPTEESLEGRAAKGVDRLRKENAELRQLTEYLAWRIHVLEKRLMGLGWSVD